VTFRRSWSKYSISMMLTILGYPAHEGTLYGSMNPRIPQNELVKETLNWLDRYLGPVR
jgi:hypothetical protein